MPPADLPADNDSPLQQPEKIAFHFEARNGHSLRPVESLSNSHRMLHAQILDCIQGPTSQVIWSCRRNNQYFIKQTIHKLATTGM